MPGTTSTAPDMAIEASPDALREALRETILFAELDDGQLDHIAAAGIVQSLRRNVVLFEEGDEPGEFYLVLSGRVAIAQESDDGRESLLAVLGPGELFGEMGFLDGHNRSAQARALEESEVLVVPYAELRLLYEDHPTALWSAVQLLARRLRATDQALSDTVFLDVMGRTAKRLLEMAGDRDEFEMPLTQEELASMVGASRERVNKAIHAFVRLGWITHDHRRYKITNRRNLESRAR
ncbi:MAG: Crp/Fnr family transcriptional regulator [Acidimicrobiaceae bacterium]|nr:Crp/Fnr family transcriptional regulator [Acidimicrobiaceae bacterium]